MTEKIDLSAVLEDSNKNKYDKELIAWLEALLIDCLGDHKEEEAIKKVIQQKPIILEVDFSICGVEMKFTDVIKKIQTHFEDNVEATMKRHIDDATQEAIEKMETLCEQAGNEFAKNLRKQVGIDHKHVPFAEAEEEEDSGCGCDDDNCEHKKDES